MLGPPLRRLRLPDRAVIDNAGGVEHNINSTKFRDCLLEDVFHVLLIRDVTCSHQIVSTELSRHAFQFLLVATDKNDAFSVGFGPSLCNSLRTMLIKC